MVRCQKSDVLSILTVLTFRLFNDYLSDNTATPGNARPS